MSKDKENKPENKIPVPTTPATAPTPAPEQHKFNRIIIGWQNESSLPVILMNKVARKKLDVELKDVVKVTNTITTINIMSPETTEPLIFTKTTLAVVSLQYKENAHDKYIATITNTLADALKIEDKIGILSISKDVTESEYNDMMEKIRQAHIEAFG